MYQILFIISDSRNALSFNIANIYNSVIARIRCKKLVNMYVRTTDTSEGIFLKSGKRSE